MSRGRLVLAMGGLGFADRPFREAIMSLAGSAWPRVCLVPTASGDSDEYVARFYRAFSTADCQLTDLQLFKRRVYDLEAYVLAQDVIYVGGGNTANLLAVWRVHGLDRILRRAWERGVLLCGASAGMNCWFEQSVTDSFDVNRLAPLRVGLGLLPGSACPHYDAEEQRRPTYRRLVSSGELADGWAVDDGAALLFSGRNLVEVIASRPQATAYRVERIAEGVRELPVAARYVGG